MLGSYTYCPTLYARQAEIKGLAQLPFATKEKLFPLIIIRPWPRAKHLSKTLEKLKEALGNHRFAADLDFSAFQSGKPIPASDEFDALFDANNGFARYYEFIAEIDEAIPVLRTGRGGGALHEQAAHIERLDRGLVVRIKYEDGGDPVTLVEQVLARFGDVSIFIDAGWARDIVAREMWASSIIEHVSGRHPEIELVVAGSSFPSAFGDVGRRGEHRIEERHLFESLARRHNSAVLIYGDWGSTRPPLPPKPMRNVPRIDLPNSREWISFRRDGDLEYDEDYPEIAKRVIADPDWPRNLNIWGTRIIEWTARGEEIAIRGPVAAAAARINIHLHRQAYFDAPSLVSDKDEPYTDDL